ncbi:MAG: SAM-dependent chlorinase/fluorinase [Pseudomonadota bacterium]
MILLFTDFGLEGPYIGQVKAVLQEAAPGVPVIDMVSDAPPFDAEASAYLLAALAPAYPTGSVILAVVDPGVGGERAALVLEADGRWYVGPDNGLFALVTRRADAKRIWQATWRPDVLSASFHGRDLFAPLAAAIARGQRPPAGCEAAALTIGADWPDERDRVIYVDRFGNLMTGRRAAALPAESRLRCGPASLRRARTFGDVARGQAFWYENANGLVEIAVNQGRADRTLGLGVGDAIAIETGEEAEG